LWISVYEVDHEQQNGRVPPFVIDGKSYTWQQIRRMPMTFEGFQVKMEICDKAEER